jgi:hypothetical protein
MDRGWPIADGLPPARERGKRTLAGRCIYVRLRLLADLRYPLTERL